MRRTIPGMIPLLALLAGCSGGQSEQSMPAAGTPTKLRVGVVNYPLQYFAKRIGGDAVEVFFPAPADVDPAFWSPNAETVAIYQQADLVLANGAGYARWVGLASLRSSRLVDTSTAFRERYVPIEDAVTHSHGPTGDHSHLGYAFTTWLDPTLSVEQARAVTEAFVASRPAAEDAFREAFFALEADLLALDSDLQRWADRIDRAPLLFSHPVYQYLAARYGLNAQSVHWEPGEMPSEEKWRELDRLRRDHAADWMIWEGTPVPEIAER